MHLFVYNNLRKGCDKHHLLGMSEYKGTYVTEGLYYMVASIPEYPEDAADARQHWKNIRAPTQPMISTVALHGMFPTTIVGELYDVRADILTLLDTQEFLADHTRYVTRIRNKYQSISAFIYVLTDRNKINAIRTNDWNYPSVLHGDWTRLKCLESSIVPLFVPANSVGEILNDNK
jgi:gamma-glutamylcyclotransferase (GGCT)/AIG2-like uncharacterized protein YtfP